ncbi:hypothetical protein N0V90_004817 [Kalmusia sp. IMI 367209]|nr:hypothetical protein N0V90_004817 [Kalmusia sp. IMI 367209]
MPLSSTHLVPYVDRPLVTSRFPRYHSYQHDSDPESYHHHRYASNVPRPLPAIAVKLQDPRLKCDRNLGWNIEWAVAFLIDHLDPRNSPDAATVLKNVRVRATILESEGHSLEIPYRIFNKLNETLFAGHLKNAVYLDIRDLKFDVSGATHSQGWGLDPKIKRVSINLNKALLQHARARDLVAALLHHMIHAYFLVACGPQVEKEVGYGRLDHGPHFGKIMMAIKHLSGTNGRPLTSLDFGHTLGHSRLFYDEYSYQRRKPHHRRRGNEKWYCSHCYSDVDALSDGEVNEWYGGVCKPLLDLPDSLRGSSVQIFNDRRMCLEEVPRAEATPSTKSNEFIFRDKPVLVPACYVDNFFSIRRAFEKAGSRYMEIHEEVGKDTFERFLELLHTGSYSPDPKHIHALGCKGPPLIKSFTASEPYLLTDIRIYAMGVKMGFDELKGMALDRMYRHSITHEDPVGLLNELYAGGEPDNDLKTWTRKFLARTPTAGDTDLFATAASPIEPSNLAKLESELLGWKPRFYDLLQQSSALKYEVGKAKRDLVASGLYAAPGAYGAVGAPLSLQRTRSMSPPMGLGIGVPLPGVGMGVGMGVPMRPGYGLPWVSPSEEMERRATAAAAAAASVAGDPYLARGLGYGDEYDDMPWGML